MFLAVEWCDVVMHFCFHYLLNIGLLQIHITMSMEGIYSFGPLVSLCVKTPFFVLFVTYPPNCIFVTEKMWTEILKMCELYYLIEWNEYYFPLTLISCGVKCCSSETSSNHSAVYDRMESPSVIPYQLVTLHNGSSEKTTLNNNKDDGKNTL